MNKAEQIPIDSKDAAIERALVLAARLEVLSKVAILGSHNSKAGDMEINEGDAYTAASFMLDLTREQQKILLEFAQ